MNGEGGGGSVYEAPKKLISSIIFLGEGRVAPLKTFKQIWKYLGFDH